MIIPDLGSGYNLVRAGNLSNNKRGGVCIYFKETLAVRTAPINSLKDCLLLEVFVGNNLKYLKYLTGKKYFKTKTFTIN